MERLHIPITGDASNFRSALQSARDGVRQMTKQIEDSGMTIEQMFGRIRNAAAMSLAGFSVKEFVQKMVQVRGEFQQLEVAFTTMLGNAEKADALMQQLARTAATVQKAQALLNATMLANPYVAVATAVAAVTAALISLGSEQDRVNAAYDEYMRKKDEAIAKEEEHKRKIDELIQIASDESLSTDTRRKALIKLEEKYPDVFKKYASEIELLKHIRDIKAEIAILDGRTSLSNPVNELAEIDKRIAELQKKGAWSLTSTNSYAGTHTSSRTRSEEEELQAKLRRRRELAKEIEKDRGETYLTNLTGVSNASLQLQINERKNLLAQMDVGEKKLGKVKFGGATGVYDRNAIKAQLQVLEREQNRRAQIVKDGSKDFVAEANKAYTEQKIALQQLEALHDPLKRAASDMTIEGKKVKDMGSDEFLAAIEKQQKERIYDNNRIVTNSDDDIKRERNVRSIFVATKLITHYLYIVEQIHGNRKDE